MIDLNTSARENFIEVLKRTKTASGLRQALDTGDLPVRDVKALVSCLRPVQHRDLLTLWLGLDRERVPTFNALAERFSTQPSSLSKMVSVARTIMLAHLQSENPGHNPFAGAITSNPSIETLLAEIDLARLQTRVSPRTAHAAVWAIQTKLTPVKEATGKTWAEIYCDELCRCQVSDFNNLRVFGVGPSVMKLLAEVLAVFGRQLGDRAGDKPVPSAPAVIEDCAKDKSAVSIPAVIVAPREFHAHPRKAGNHLTPPKKTLILPPLFEGFYQAVWRGCAKRDKFEADFQAAVWGHDSPWHMMRGDDLVQVACLFARQIIRPHIRRLVIILREHLKSSEILKTANSLLLHAQPAELTWVKCWVAIGRRISAATAGKNRPLPDKRLQASVCLCLGVVAQSYSRPLWAEPVSLSEFTKRTDEEQSVRLHKQSRLSNEHGENFIRLLVEATLEDKYGTVRPSRDPAILHSAASLYGELAEQMLRTLNEYKKETA